MAGIIILGAFTMLAPTTGDDDRQYLSNFLIATALYNAADQVIDNAANYAVAGVNVPVNPGQQSQFLLTSTGFDIRPDVLTANVVVDVWINVSGTRQTVKYPVGVFTAITGKIHVDIGLALSGFLQVAFWTSYHAAGTYSMNIMVRIEGSTVPSPTVFVSDTYMNVGIISKAA